MSPLASCAETKGLSQPARFAINPKSGDAGGSGVLQPIEEAGAPTLNRQTERGRAMPTPLRAMNQL